MANDWIKMRLDLNSHPKIVRILSATKTDKFRVIGGLHAVWSVFDTHSEDGILKGYDAETMDHIIGWTGFSNAMIAVGWLEETPEGLAMPEFEEHNGKSAKRRAEDQKRKRGQRKSDTTPKDVPKDCGQDADKVRSREEKRRVYKKNIQKKFSKPSLDELIEYCRERQNSVSAERFMDYYEANGWRVGKNPMKCWKAAIRTWEKNQSPPTTPAGNSFDDEVFS